MISDAQLMTLSASLGARLLARRLHIVTAESCTGGWIGKVLTDIAGSSAWYLGGVIAYGNELKEALLGVSNTTLLDHGAVSEAAAREMAVGALERIGGEVAVAVTGIAGPTGGAPEKPVGTVWFAWAVRSQDGVQVRVRHEVFPGDREGIRRATVELALSEVFNLGL